MIAAVRNVARNAARLALLPASLALVTACAETQSVSDAQYQVTGTVCAADISSTDAHGRTVALAKHPVPWSSAFLYDPGALQGVIISLGVTNRCAWGELTAQIYLDGLLMGSQTCATPFCTVNVVIRL